MNVLMLHGINHNMFGKRDPVQYGTITLDEIDARLQALGKELDVEVVSFQTNGEKEMCERIHRGFALGFEVSGHDVGRRCGAQQRGERARPSPRGPAAPSPLPLERSTTPAVPR